MRDELTKKVMNGRRSGKSFETISKELNLVEPYLRRIFRYKGKNRPYESTRREVKERDGNKCVSCSGTFRLECITYLARQLTARETC